MKKQILIILTTLLLASCSKNEEAKTEEKGTVVANDLVALNDTQVKNAGILTSSINKENISNKIFLNGEIDVPPQNMASVSSTTGGFVKVSRFMPGNYVKAGQTLAVLENPELAQLQQDYLQAKSNLSYAQKDFERQKYLNKYQASSDKVMQKAQNEAQNQNTAVNGIASRLRSYGINPNGVSSGNIQKTVAVTAPISGYISTVNINLGQYVSPSEKMFDIVNTSDVHLMLKVFEKDLNKIALGQKVFAYTNQNPENKHPAEIILISKDFAPNRSVLVHCHFLDYDETLIPGTYMNAEIETDSENGTIIPEDGIVTWEGKQYIFEEIKPKTYKMFRVTIGNSENGYTELVNFDPKNLNKKFVTKGAYQLLMALKNVEE